MISNNDITRKVICFLLAENMRRVQQDEQDREKEGRRRKELRIKN
jgi:hypothetical protein